MKGSLIILAFFVVGVFVGFKGIIPAELLKEEWNTYVLYALMLLVGVTIGYDRELLISLRKVNLSIVLVPLATIVGTLIGTFIISFFIRDWNAAESMAVGSGFGYYSLSSIFITQYKGVTLGTIALMSNLIRELMALLMAPLARKWFARWRRFLLQAPQVWILHYPLSHNTPANNMFSLRSSMVY
ncbi:lysine exporter LysO family protein [Sphingobacterium sp. E70]|nr:lysine exporter LysO family protein [Sphingobacterium sp. E70]ULT22584.1 lysine exporter LysO family protein [Sphingobacterium sp. E70]